MDYVIIIPPHVGKALRSQRKTLHLSQKQAAEKSGLLQKTVSLIERDPERASVESLFKLINALDLSLTLTQKRESGIQIQSSEKKGVNNREIW